MEHSPSTCDGCIWHERMCTDVLTGLSGFDFDKEWAKAWRKYQTMCPCFKKSTTHKGNGTHNGLFAGTLTMSPEWGKTEEDIVHACEKIMSQKTCPVEKYAWYLEQTENGTPHIHFIYKTASGGRIHQKVFKRYWEWDESVSIGKGHKGGYHKPVKSEIAYQEYISKDEGRHGMSGFDSG